MAITNCGSAKEKWEAWNACGLYKVDSTIKMDHVPLPLRNEVQKTMAWCKTNSFLDGYF